MKQENTLLRAYDVTFCFFLKAPIEKTDCVIKCLTVLSMKLNRAKTLAAVMSFMNLSPKYCQQVSVSQSHLVQ